MEAIRTALTVGVGTGGAFALWMAARRQRSTEVQLHESARAADAAELDSRERRLTDLYVQAVEQIGSDKAAVRLGGLYALERLAWDDVDRRAVVINVLCSYLRMPYLVPEQLKNGRYRLPAASDLRQHEEWQVRITVQHLLGNLLRDQPYDLDLRGATLIEFDLRECAIGKALFHDAQFISTPKFMGATFHDEVWVFDTSFDTVARLEGATFLDRAIFTRCAFYKLCLQDAAFAGGASFIQSKFAGKADMSQVTFKSGIEFEDCVLDMDRYAAEGMRERGWESPEIDLTGAVADVSSLGTPVTLPSGWQLQGSSIVRAATLEPKPSSA
ncbi:pentapeptide repeat-containing protein [Amycolatopsis roodepoortensis]|uniref:pentapeptide repeat-containing protein n=1 Tax=Amycolatopsis roodepoortensis TaxID=700274 RepID=UPI00214C9DFF|nr:pentapeptide repeat-containing protein [Amycolatopsis roodepoortensis]UUV32958.1 pentapeptide repeat-containing protein [Amycolatopsis roodepoortensis]